MRKKLPFLIKIGVCAALIVFLLFVLARRQPSVPSSGSNATEPLVPFATIPPKPGGEVLLGAEIRGIVGLEPDVPRNKRIELLRSLGSGLTKDECDALLHGILAPAPKGVSTGEHAHYVHEACRLLRKQDNERPRFARALATLAIDDSRSPILRDYAMQHLRVVWDFAPPADGLRLSIVETFRMLLDDPAMAPAALLSLHLLGSPTELGVSSGTVVVRTRPQYELPDDEIIPHVKRFLADRQSPLSGRMASVRIVAERTLLMFKEDLVGMAGGETGEHTMLRMAAISALARFGDPSDLKFLKSLDDADPRIQSALRLALAKASRTQI